MLGIGAYPDTWVPQGHWGEHDIWARAHALAGISVVATSLCLVLTALVPLVVLFRRERTRTLSFPEAAATGLSVAADGTGFSVAVAHGDDARILQVDSLEDARRVATEVKARFPAQGDIRLTLPRQSPFLAVAMFSLVALVLAALVPMFQSFHGGLEALALLSVPIVVLLAMLVVLRVRQPLKLHWGAAGNASLPRSLDRSPIERQVAKHMANRLTSDPAPPRIRVDLFGRGDDTVAAWLARLDAMPSGSGYRGEGASRELLYETVNDPNAAIDVRLAAGRLLRVREREERARIVEEVKDEEVRARLEAVTLDDAAEAEAALDAVGPMFRTRR